MAPGGTWKIVRTYGTGNAWTLSSSLYAKGNFQVGVWAKQAGSTKSHDAFFIGSYWITPPAGCVVAALSPSAASPLTVGGSVVFTPQQSGCTRQYRFWLARPGGSFTTVQAYGVGTTWTWKTSGQALGVYQVGVWEASGTTHQSYAITTVTLGVVTCTSAGMSPNLAAPQVQGANVTFTAMSTRCGSPLYEFWLLAPGGAWTVKQGYGVATWSWSTVGLAPGTYQVGVWSRQSGSTSSRDSYFISTYQITGA